MACLGNDILIAVIKPLRAIVSWSNALYLQHVNQFILILGRSSSN